MLDEGVAFSSSLKPQAFSGFQRIQNMLNIEKLHQYYGGSHILRGLSFDVKVGEVTCLLGRNGVGKTPLLK